MCIRQVAVRRVSNVVRFALTITYTGITRPHVQRPSAPQQQQRSRLDCDCTVMVAQRTCSNSSSSGAVATQTVETRGGIDSPEWRDRVSNI